MVIHRLEVDCVSPFIAINRIIYASTLPARSRTVENNLLPSGRRLMFARLRAGVKQARKKSRHLVSNNWILPGSKAFLPLKAVVEGFAVARSERIDPSGVWVIGICSSQIRHSLLFVAPQAWGHKRGESVLNSCTHRSQLPLAHKYRQDSC